MKWKYGNQIVEMLIGKKNERKENSNLPSEKEILLNFIKNFNYDLKIVSNSANYTTVQYHDFDLLRLKYGTLAKWIEVCMPTEIKKKYINNPLFEMEKNKNRVFWKAKIEKAEDLNYFIDIINENLIIRDKKD